MTYAMKGTNHCELILHIDKHGFAEFGYQTDRFREDKYFDKFGYDVNYLKLEEVSVLKKIENRLVVSSGHKGVYWEWGNAVEDFRFYLTR